MKDDKLFKSKPEAKRLIIFSLIAIILIPFSLWMFTIVYHDYIYKHKDPVKSAAVSAMLMVIGCALAFTIFKNTRKVSIDNQNIYYKGRQIPFTEIANIAVDAVNTTLLWGDIEVLNLQLKSGEEISFKIKFYANGYLLRSICEKIQNNIINKIYQLDSFKPEIVNVHEISFNSLVNEDFTNWYSNPLTSYMTYVCLLFFLPPLFLSAFLIHLGGLVPAIFSLVLACQAILLLFVFSIVQNSFHISPNYIVINNKFFLWKKPVVIPIKKVRRVSTQKYKTSAGVPLSIMTADYKVWNFRTLESGTKNIDRLINLIESYMTK